jgi:chromosome segregation ATPase
MTRTKHLAVTAILATVFLASGCRSMYYSTMEVFGQEKRHILKSDIAAVSKEQGKAATQFKDALTRLKEMYGYEGGDLEKTYRKLQSDYEDCVTRAAAVRTRIRDMKQVAGDLFKEWEQENAQISNADLRSKSARSLRDTRQRYQRLEEAVTRAADRMDPVLIQLKDYVLYLKHNLNAQAAGSLKGEADKIQLQVDQLIADVKKSVSEADEFLKAFEKPD